MEGIIELINHNKNNDSDEKILTYAQSNYGGYLHQIIYNNFMYEIGSYLLKNEKIQLRQLNKHYLKNIFPLFSLFLNIRNRSEKDFLCSKIDLKFLFSNFCNIDKLNIESLKLNNTILKGIEILINENKKNIKVLSLSNVDYDGIDNICILESLIDKLEELEELKISNVGNRDKLLINLEKNEKKLRIFDKIKIIKLDNLPLTQITYILNNFNRIDTLCIENCSLDEDLQVVESFINRKNKNSNDFVLKNLIGLNLSFNGLSSIIAIESLKKILINQKNLENLTLKGMWFHDIYQLNEEFKLLERVTLLDLSASKNIFNGLNSVYCFCELKNLKILNLGDTRMEDSDLKKILESFKQKNMKCLEDLNLFRCLLTDETITHLSENYDVLENLKIINLTFNHGITEKGFNKLLDNIFKFKSLKHVNLRNTGINLKYSTKNILNFLLKYAAFKNPSIKINEDKNFIAQTNNLNNSFIIPINSRKDSIVINKNYQIKNVSNGVEYISQEISESKYDANEIKLEIIDLYFCTLYDIDYINLIESIEKTLNANHINAYLNLKIGLKIYNNKKVISKIVERIQNDLYKNYNLIIK